MKKLLLVVFLMALPLLGQRKIVSDVVTTGRVTGVDFKLREPAAYGAPWLQRVDLKNWSGGDGTWIYSVGRPLPLSTSQRIVITGGSGWTAGVYTVTSAVSQSTPDGTQNTLKLSSAPSALGAVNGVGHILGDYAENQVVCFGNSLTLGSGTTNYPARLLIGLGGTWAVRNNGVSGYTAAQLSPLVDSAILPQFKPTMFDRQIAVVWEGTNSLFTGATLETALNDYFDLLDRIRSRGFRVIAVTVLPRSQAGTPVTFEANRLAFNAELRRASHIGQHFDALADVAADTRIGDLGDETNATYYVDLVHMTLAGYQIVADIVLAAVQSL